VNLSFSKRIEEIEELIFFKLNSYRNKENLIDLSRGVPFGSPPKELIYELNMRSQYEANHIYNDMRGLKELREEIAYFYEDAYNVKLDPETEVQVLIGSKEGIANLMLALTNPGDSIIIQNPAFPVYFNAVRFARANFTWANLYEKNNYLIDYKELSNNLKGNEKLMIFNYPNSPTGAACALKDFEDAYAFCAKHNIILLHDAVYRELSFKKHPTLLEVPGSKQLGVEIGSLSKTFNMSGWRIAYMVGNKEILARLKAIKTIFDVGQFVPIQYAATLAIKMVSYIEQVAKNYSDKVDKVISYLDAYGIKYFKPASSYSIWCTIPNSFKNSLDFINYMYETYNVLYMPGSGFGANGDKNFRISLTRSDEEIIKGVKKLEHISYMYKDSGSLRVN